MSVCGKIPYRRSSFRSKLRGRQTSVNELNHDCDSGTFSMSIPKNTEYGNVTNTVPKQVLDVVNLANSGMNSGKNLPHHSELDTLSTSGQSQDPVQLTQVFSNIEINAVLECCKQGTGAEINAMPLNVYDQLNQKLDGKLELKVLQ